MKLKIKFSKIVLLFVITFSLAFLGCDFSSAEDEENNSSGNSGNENSSENGSGNSNSGNVNTEEFFVLLSEAEWYNDRISYDRQKNRYRFAVKEGMRYFIYLNDKNDGDDTKTAEQIGLKIYHSDDTVISSDYYKVTGCWQRPFTFVAENDGIVTVTAANYYNRDWEKGTGTYAIKYTSRRNCGFLEKDKWENDSIITDKQINKYKIDVQKDMRYFIYINDKNDGDGTKTANKIGIKVSHSDGTVFCDSYNCEFYKTPFSFVSLSDGVVSITAANYYNYNWESGIGSYSIRYRVRPEYITLSVDGEWKNDSIIVDGQTNKYKVAVEAGKKYVVHLSEENSPAVLTSANRKGFKIKYSQDSNVPNYIICDSYSDTESDYSKSYQYEFNASGDGIIIITVANYWYIYWERGAGAYSIKITEKQQM